MALNYKLAHGEFSDWSKIKTLDITGVYDVTDNPGGFGTPNPAIGDVLELILTVVKPDPITLLPSVDTAMAIDIDAYYSSPNGNLPNTTGVPQYIKAVDLGYTDEKLAIGIYRIIANGSGVSGTTPFVFSNTEYFLSIGSVNCCLTKMFLKGSIKDCCGCFNKNSPMNKAQLGKTYLTGALLAFQNKDYNKCAEDLKRAQEICDNCVPCKC